MFSDGPDDPIMDMGGRINFLEQLESLHEAGKRLLSDKDKRITELEAENKRLREEIVQFRIMFANPKKGEQCRD